MKKKIFGFMTINIILGLLLLMLLTSFVVYTQVNDIMRTALRQERVTIISETGDVIFDNQANPETMDNHLDRPEVQDALRLGAGESERFSDSLLEKSYYYAMRMRDNTVLRLSITGRGAASVISALLPLFLICAAAALIVASYTARYLTNKIIEPINNIDLDTEDIEAYDELSPLIRRISQQKDELAKQLAALENRADTIKIIIDNMTEGLVLTDRTGIILSANQSAEAVFGHTKTGNKNLIAVCRDKSLIAAMHQCLSGKRAEVQLKSGGQTYCVYLNPVLSDKNDESAVSGAVLLFINITNKIRADKQRREFSANVSHELKTPLTTISGLVEMLENGMVLETDKAEFLSKISAQTKRLKSVVDDIIRLSEYDEGRARGEFTAVNAYNLAQNVATQLIGKAREKNITLTVTGSDVTVSAIEHMIDEMLYNLIDNGIKYTNSGGAVTVLAEETGKFCRITVSDTGIGIPPEHQPHIFERFYTVDKSRCKKTDGTGLGLSIVKHAVEFHKGSIELDSIEGKGTAITCLIPKKG